MADVTAPTNPRTLGLDGELRRKFTAATALTAGNSVYLNSSGQAAKARGNAAGTAYAIGIALETVASGETVTVAMAPSSVTGFSDLVAGTIYCASAAVAGSIAPLDDISAYEYACVLGVAESAATLLLQPMSVVLETA